MPVDNQPAQHPEPLLDIDGLTEAVQSGVDGAVIDVPRLVAADLRLGVGL